VETADDIFEQLRPLAAALGSCAPVSAKTAESTALLAPALDKGYEILLDALGFEPASVDVLIARTGLKADEVASMLLILELESRIDACPGGRYARRANSLVESGRGPFDSKAAK
jgi:DNA processing protein